MGMKVRMILVIVVVDCSGFFDAKYDDDDDGGGGGGGGEINDKGGLGAYLEGVGAVPSPRQVPF